MFGFLPISPDFACFCIWLRLALHVSDFIWFYLLPHLSKFHHAFGSACLHLSFEFHRIETSSSTESALWDAQKLRVCFSVLANFGFDKLPMFTDAAL
ncbi:hypothetical protein Tco_0998445 [Tanacetum coccineum]